MSMQHTPLLEVEEAPLLEATGRVLCRDLYSAIQQPPFDGSPLDGDAVVGADLAGASREKPVILSVVDKLYAGCGLLSFPPAMRCASPNSPFRRKKL